jgi:2-keto-4-pentenoate hydratase/2-oxohepta-3-ene-1,7-dioic acid hydratase in catechol pathway
MKLLMDIAGGVASSGLLIGGDVLNFRASARALPDAATIGASLVGVLEAGQAARDAMAKIEAKVLNDAALADRLRAGGALKPLVDARLAAPLADARLILGGGRNYASHSREMSGQAIEKPQWPTSFIKCAATVTGPRDPIVLPKHNPDMVDWEGEIGAVFGRVCHGVDAVEALACISGYTLINDVSARDWMVPGNPLAERNILGKQFATFCPMGPVVVTADEVPDPAVLTLTTRVNGEVMQHASNRDLIFNLGELIAYYAQFYTFLPGDIITGGTPAGVGFGRNPKRFLKVGDRVEVSVAEIGTLSNPVVAAMDAWA